MNRELTYPCPRSGFSSILGQVNVQSSVRPVSVEACSDRAYCSKYRERGVNINSTVPIDINADMKITAEPSLLRSKKKSRVDTTPNTIPAFPPDKIIMLKPANAAATNQPCGRRELSVRARIRSVPAVITRPFADAFSLPPSANMGRPSVSIRASGNRESKRKAHKL